MWILVLGGAELIRSMETFKTTWQGYEYPDLVAVLVVLWECWRKQQNGESLSNRDLTEAGLEEQHWRRLRDLLLEKHILAETSSGYYVLTRDPSHLHIKDLAALGGNGATMLPGPKASNVLTKYPWFSTLSDILNQANQQLENTFSPTVAELFESNTSMENYRDTKD